MTSSRNLPTVAIVATGGTIAGEGATSSHSVAYKAATVPVEQLIAGVPALARVARLRSEQVLQMPSESLTHADLVRLGKRIRQLVSEDGIDGVVVTHGTDTLEETAYFLNLVVRTHKPIVLVGSMRPSTAMSADGAHNLFDAVIVAGDTASVGRGVLVTMNQEIHAGRDATKRVNVTTSAFGSQWGALGLVIEGQTFWFRRSVKRHTADSEFDIDAMDSLADVQIVYGVGNMSPAVLDAAVDAGAQAIVYAGTGNCSVPAYLVDSLRAVRARGIHIIRSSRVPNGLVMRNGAQPDDAYDWVVAHDLNPQKAKILAAVALTRKQDSRSLQRIFWEY